VVATPLPEAKAGRVPDPGGVRPFAEAVTQVYGLPESPTPGLAAFLQGESWDAKADRFLGTSWRDYERNRSHPRLSITTMFPIRACPCHAQFVKQRLDALAKRVDLQVISPIPWFPGND